jgi:hypothetical protein
VGKFTIKKVELSLEQSLEMIPIAEWSIDPHPVLGEATAGLTRTVSPQEQAVSAQETQHMAPCGHRWDKVTFSSK